MPYTIEWNGDDDDAANPEEAARNMLDMIRNSDGGCHIFIVRDENTKKLFRVDLGSEEDREGEPVCREMTSQELAQQGIR
jgi:hypothetical protein